MDKIAFILDYFERSNPNVQSELHFQDAYQLLVATILAAQCTDKRVNMVTPQLFSAYPTVRDLSNATEDKILTFIKSISYPNNKAKHLVAMGRMVVSKFNGEIPNNLRDLVSLPGVGRKTANVVLAFAFAQPAMPVDTHVFRVAHRLGLVSDKAKTPEMVEKQLVDQVPVQYLCKMHHWLLLHGRYVCLARKPQCYQCPLSDICSSKNKE